MARRSWLFVPGADEDAHERAARSSADVIVLELEDFTPPDLRPRRFAHRDAGAAGRGRSRSGEELACFLVECRAADVEAIDCPYTFSDVRGAVADAELRKARRIVAAFEKARAAGRDRAKVDGALIEVPIYAAAKRLLESVARS